MDLSTFKPGEEGAELTLLNPLTGEPICTDDKPWTIRLASCDSSRYLNAKRKIGDRALTRAKRAGAKRANGSTEEFEMAGAELLGEVTLSWSSEIVDEGVHPECTPKNARDLYLKYPWLGEQVDAFVHDRSEHLGN